MLIDYRNLLASLQRGAPTPSSEAPASNVDSEFAERLESARDAAIQSYRNRYGRLPSEAELEASAPNFLTNEDRAVYEQQRSVRPPLLARGVLPRPTIPPLPPLPPMRTPSFPQTPSAPDTPRSPFEGPFSYLDAAWKTLGVYGATALALPAIARELIAPQSEGNRFQDSEEIKRWGASVQLALAAQVKAYNELKSDPRKSYQTYTKERIDLGPCLFSQKEDPHLPCYYAGMTGGEDSAGANVSARDRQQYPEPWYYDAQVDCSTKSWVAARAREQELIQHFRDAGISDNDINSIADHLWRPYMMEMAQRECGHIPLPQPKRR